MANILVVDDDELFCEVLTGKLEKGGHAVSCAHTLADARAKSLEESFWIVFLDVSLPDGNGLDSLVELKGSPSAPEIIIMTGDGSRFGVEKAINNGAWCYLEKPNVIREMMLPLTRALEYRTEKMRAYAEAPLINRETIIGNSQQLKKCLQQVATAGANDLNVMISGDTGTGKEVFARAVHQNSKRVAGNFVVVDCAALPDTLVESLLFGHEKGAFTGASTRRKGLVEHADGGTLFLDEVGELPRSVQKSFLRVLQERRFRPVGMSEEVTSDFRLIAATNRNLETMVADGGFRQDLFYRLKSLQIDLPPVRERADDVIELATFFINMISKRYGHENKTFSADFVEAIKLYHWPGNVRELFHALEMVSAVAIHSPTIYARHLPDRIRVHLAQESFGRIGSSKQNQDYSTKVDRFETWKEFKKSSELVFLKRLLSTTKGNIKDSCSVSGLSRARLYQLLKKHDLPLPSSNS